MRARASAAPSMDHGEALLDLALLSDGTHTEVDDAKGKGEPPRSSGRQPVAGPRVAGKRGGEGAVRIERDGVARIGIALGGVRDEPALRVEDAEAPPVGRDVPALDRVVAGGM